MSGSSVVAAPSVLVRAATFYCLIGRGRAPDPLIFAPAQFLPPVSPGVFQNALFSFPAESAESHFRQRQFFPFSKTDFFQFLKKSQSSKLIYAKNMPFQKCGLFVFVFFWPGGVPGSNQKRAVLKMPSAFRAGLWPNVCGYGVRKTPSSARAHFQNS